MGLVCGVLQEYDENCSTLMNNAGMLIFSIRRMEFKAFQLGCDIVSYQMEILKTGQVLMQVLMPNEKSDWTLLADLPSVWTVT